MSADDGAGPVTSAELTPAGLAALGPGNDCDQEPIHLSGAVQPPGIRLAVDPRSGLVEVASDSLEELVGQPAEDVGADIGNAGLPSRRAAPGLRPPEQLTALRRLGCDMGQGYLFGRPVPQREFEAAAAPSL